MKICANLIVAALAIGLPATEVHATDPAREADLVGGITSRYESEETVWLNSAGSRFAALVREGGKKQLEGGVLLLHGIDETPDDPELLRMLRKALPERGWTTLSLFAPVREGGADTREYLGLVAESLGRLQAGVGYLADKQATPIVMIGQRAGAAMLIRYLAQSADAKVGSAVLINMPDLLAEESWKDLEKISIPLLDIVAGGANPRGDEQALKRKRLMKNNERYRQVVIADAGGDLGVLRELLGNRIHGWLKREMMPDAGAKE